MIRQNHILGGYSDKKYIFNRSADINVTFRHCWSIIVPTANTKSEPSELFRWEVKVQAFQNNVNVAMCNRVGREGNMEFSGESIVVGFDGETIALAGNQEELILAEVNLSGATLKRHQRPYTSLRRTDLYE